MTDPNTTQKLDYTPGKDGMEPGQTAKGRAIHRIEFRAGDGPMIAIEPDYALELERAPQSMVISWQEDGQPMNAAIPVVEFNTFLDEGKIVIV